MPGQDKKDNVIRIGEYLLKKGIVKDSEIFKALEIQERTKARIGEILQSEGYISSFRFYKEFAEFKGFEFINLEKANINYEIMTNRDRNYYFEMSFVPFDDKNGVVYIATTDFNPSLEQYLDKAYKEYKVFYTSSLDILWTLQKRFTEMDIHYACEKLYEEMPSSSSKNPVSSLMIIAFLLLILSSGAYFLSESKNFIGFILVMNIFYLSVLVSKAFFFITGVLQLKSQTNLDFEKTSDKDLPTYSILVPLFKEKGKTIKNLIKSLGNLDYPKNKLDIKLIVEIEDFKTLEEIKKLKPPAFFQIVRVPNSKPKTKPKACNYALRFCRGEYVTIYDAEDVPDKDQLKKVVATFNEKNESVSCVQARLNYYNREENILSKLFSVEYSSWFDFTLYGLKRFDMPIPLGGTSNHFPIEVLKKIYAWDPYNVMENADLGMRLSLLGYKTKVIDSYTMEECPVTLKAWISQRVRWVKGYIQTFIVHSKGLVNMFKTLGRKGVVGFFYFFGAPFLVFLSVPMIFLLSLIGLSFGSEVPVWLYQLSVVNIVLVLIVHVLMGVYIVSARRWNGMFGATLIFPFYWVMHFFASYGSLHQLITKPHHWNKTEHGVSKFVPSD